MSFNLCQSSSFEFQKFPCHYHQKQFLTNFCSDQQCQLPLCPICVDLHSKEHTLNGTLPQIEHIDETFQKTLKQIKDLKNQQISVKQDFNSIQTQRQKLKQEMITISNNKKQQCHQLIDNYFQNLNNNITESFEGINSEQNVELNSIKQQTEKMNKQIDEKQKKLTNKSQMLEALIEINSNQDLEFVHNNLNQQKIQLYSFPQLLPQIIVQDQAFDNLEQALPSIIRIENIGNNQQGYNQQFSTYSQRSQFQTPWQAQQSVQLSNSSLFNSQLPSNNFAHSHFVQSVQQPMLQSHFTQPISQPIRQSGTPFHQFY